MLNYHETCKTDHSLSSARHKEVAIRCVTNTVDEATMILQTKHTTRQQNNAINNQECKQIRTSDSTYYYIIIETKTVAAKPEMCKVSH